jgi:DTW domain-containing protein YfiP
MCSYIIPRETDTRVIVVMHRRELIKTTSSAHFASQCLVHCDIRVRGHAADPVRIPERLDQNRRLLVLYPTDAATPLKDAIVGDDRPITLVVPDGSWRQASKIPRREPDLANVQAVRLPSSIHAPFALRREPKSFGMSTATAIFHALSIIEGEQAMSTCFSLYEHWISKMLQARGLPI